LKYVLKGTLITQLEKWVLYGVNSIFNNFFYQLIINFKCFIQTLFSRYFSLTWCYILHIVDKLYTF